MVMSYLKGRLPRASVLRRITEDRLASCRDKGVDISIVAPPCVLEPELIDEEENRLLPDEISEKLDIAIAAAKFAQLKHEGPTTP